MITIEPLEFLRLVLLVSISTSIASITWSCILLVKILDLSRRIQKLENPMLDLEITLEDEFPGKECNRILTETEAPSINEILGTKSATIIIKKGKDS